MPHQNLHIIPTTVALLTPATLLITYLLAVLDKDVLPIFPYVSTAGAAGFEMAACVYARHLFIRKFARFRSPKGFYRNRLSTCVGLASCFGLDIVANFQVTKVPYVHYIGAALCFFGSLVYFYMQTMLSRHMSEDLEPRNLFYLRLLLVFLVFSLLIMALVGGILAKIEFNGVQMRQWKPSDGGYGFHVMSAAAEWLTVFTQAALVVTFLPGFKCVAIKHPRVVIDGLYSSPLIRLETVSSSIITG